MSETTSMTTTNDVNVMALIDKGVTNNLSPEAMGQLYQLHQRIQADNAKREFREALMRFQRTCPSIGKDRMGGKARYATIEHIADMIRDTLEACGLTYTFDTSVKAEGVEVTCWIHHLGGHSEPSRFTSVADGTAAMNATQRLASAVSYGKRYSLCNGLGIVIRQEDDDGESAAPPDAPAAAAGPITQPRGQRVTLDECKRLHEHWVKQMKSNRLSFNDEAWVALVCGCTKIPAEQAFKTEAWTRDDLRAVAKDIGVELE